MSRLTTRMRVLANLIDELDLRGAIAVDTADLLVSIDANSCTVQVAGFAPIWDRVAAARTVAAALEMPAPAIHTSAADDSQHFTSRTVPDRTVPDSGAGGWSDFYMRVTTILSLSESWPADVADVAGDAEGGES